MKGMHFSTKNAHLLNYISSISYIFLCLIKKAGAFFLLLLKFSNDHFFQSGTCRLMFHAKGSNQGGQRQQSQRYCDEISKILQHFLPGKARPFVAVIFYTRQTYTIILNLGSEPRKRTDHNQVMKKS